MSRKKRDREKEMSEWMILKDIAKNSKESNKGKSVMYTHTVYIVVVDFAYNVILYYTLYSTM